MKKAVITMSEIIYSYNGTVRTALGLSMAEINMRGDFEAIDNVVSTYGLSRNDIQKDEYVTETLSLVDFLTDLGNYLSKGSKVNAIKRLRGVTGLGLKESKDLIDNLTYIHDFRV